MVGKIEDSAGADRAGTSRAERRVGAVAPDAECEDCQSTILPPAGQTVRFPTCHCPQSPAPTAGQLSDSERGAVQGRWKLPWNPSACCTRPIGGDFPRFQVQRDRIGQSAINSQSLYTGMTLHRPVQIPLPIRADAGARLNDCSPLEPQDNRAISIVRDVRRHRSMAGAAQTFVSQWRPETCQADTGCRLAEMQLGPEPDLTHDRSRTRLPAPLYRPFRFRKAATCIYATRANPCTRV